MSNRSFINRPAEERRQRLVVGGVVTRDRVPGLVGGFELIEYGVHCLVGIGDLALPLHGVEIVHIGRIGLFIVAKQAHRISRRTLYFDVFSSREPESTSLENAMILFDDFRHQKEMVLGLRRV